MIMMDKTNTMKFVDVWSDSEEFQEDYLNSPLATNYEHLHYGETVNNKTYPNNVELLFALLYARYGNSPIANIDVNQFKYKVFSIIFQYGLNWQKEIEIQQNLRGLSEAEIMQGSKAIYNHARHDGSAPSTDSLEETPYIDEQNTTNYKRGKLEGYNTLLILLKTDVTNIFLDKFRRLFVVIATPSFGARILSDYEEDE